jgi:hypothetical protein
VTPQIVRKLQAEIRSGISKESQVVYILAGIRKIIERENLPPERYFYLKFHCDWTLHAKLSRKPAQQILSHFNLAHIQLLAGEKLSPNIEVSKISKMDLFREEISSFLCANSIYDFSKSHEGWIKFLLLYARVVEDIPVIIQNDSSAMIKEVTLSVEVAKDQVEETQFFKVTWRITDRNGKSGSIFVINSFQANS